MTATYSEMLSRSREEKILVMFIYSVCRIHDRALPPALFLHRDLVQFPPLWLKPCFLLELKKEEREYIQKCFYYFFLPNGEPVCRNMFTSGCQSALTLFVVCFNSLKFRGKSELHLVHSLKKAHYIKASWFLLQFLFSSVFLKLRTVMLRGHGRQSGNLVGRRSLHCRHLGRGFNGLAAVPLYNAGRPDSRFIHCRHTIWFSSLNHGDKN